VRAANSFKMGDPTKTDTYLGPLAMPTQAAFLQKQVDDAVSKGAVVLCGGTRKGVLLGGEKKEEKK
jgi:acyl-CoA reductase-like NAD-dependent aldehyde dehydrogenase